MNAAGEQRVHRVFVALDAASSAREALDAAAGLAAELDAELAGCFVEDVNVLRAAAFSFTREMGLSSGTSRPFTLEEVERALRAQAQSAQSALAQVAGELQLRWSFTTLRGPGLAPVLRLADEVTLAVMPARSGLPDGLAPMSRRPHRQTRRTEPPVAVIYDGSEEALSAVRVAARVARSRAAPLLVILCASEEADFDALRQRLDAACPADVAAARYVSPSDASPTCIAADARHASAAFLVLGNRPGSTDDVMELLSRLDCPLVVVTRAEAVPGTTLPE
jgi:nucleotide-binding universal stress UspA family protein